MSSILSSFKYKTFPFENILFWATYKLKKEGSVLNKLLQIWIYTVKNFKLKYSTEFKSWFVPRIIIVIKIDIKSVIQSRY